MAQGWCRQPWLVAALLLLALALRAAVVLGKDDYEAMFDAADYHAAGSSIASGEGYPESIFVTGGGPSAFTPPGYPLFLAAVYRVVGSDTTAGLLAQALLGTAVVALTGLLACQLWGSRAGLASLALAGVAPPLLFPGADLVAEPLFTALVLAAVAAALHQRRSGHRYRWVIVTGLLAGLATITRSNGIVILLPLAVAMAPPQPWRSWKALAAPATLVAVALVVIVPWAVRNYVVTDSFIPLSTRLGYALARTYNEDARTDAAMPSTPHSTPEMKRIFTDPSISETEASSRLSSLAVEFMKAHPEYVGETIGRNTLRAFHLIDVDLARFFFRGSQVGPRFANVSIYGLYVVAVLALVGAFTPAARHAPLWLWLVPLLLLASVLPMADGRPRYRSPIDPFLVLLAGAALATAWDRFFPRRNLTAAPGKRQLPLTRSAVSRASSGDFPERPVM